MPEKRKNIVDHFQYYDDFDKVYINAQKFSNGFNLSDFSQLVASWYDALRTGGYLIFDTNGVVVDIESVDALLSLFFNKEKDDDGIIYYIKTSDGIEAENLQ